ncbi:hypothetical protein D1610_11585 [Sphingomonas gilva]|uniref:PhoD-like phosphatase metallophosphatase domain-containing protein n=1 Tax=Sphingomonas gilva TaxID=2305907 RepID=A0A396RLF9_9SPHN|nr:alkaline phosphatase D family protein [Sphingomonas gilva]RHW17184.1 hypothetical protein D1610_11585 [Sphingomonas gilva]
MPVTIETRDIEQLPELAAVSPDAWTIAQEPGGPAGKVALKNLLGKLIATDTAKETAADLAADLAHPANEVALVFADPTPASCGWYRKTGAEGAGEWVQFEKLGAQAKAEVDAATVAALVAIAEQTEQLDDAAEQLGDAVALIAAGPHPILDLPDPDPARFLLIDDYSDTPRPAYSDGSAWRWDNDGSVVEPMPGIASKYAGMAAWADFGANSYALPDAEDATLPSLAAQLDWLANYSVDNRSRFVVDQDGLFRDFNDGRNLIRKSEDFSGAEWTKTGVTLADQLVSPSGATLTKVNQVANNTAARIATVSTFDYQTHAFAIEAKAAELSMLVIGTQHGDTFFDLATGTVGTSHALHRDATLTDLGGGVYRARLVSDVQNSTFTVRLAAGSDLTPNGNGGGMYLGGAQVTRGDAIVAYEKTDAAHSVLRELAIDHRHGRPMFRRSIATGNLLRYNLDPSQAVWTKTGATIGAAAVGPDGKQSQRPLIEDASTGPHAITQSVTKTGSTNTGRMTGFVPKSATRRAYLDARPASAAAIAWFDPATGAFGTIGAGCTVEIEEFPDHWRVGLFWTGFSSGTYALRWGMSDADGVTDYTGDGVSEMAWWGLTADAGQAELPHGLAVHHNPLTAQIATTALDDLVLPASVQALLVGGDYTLVMRGRDMRGGSEARLLGADYSAGKPSFELFFGTAPFLPNKGTARMTVTSIVQGSANGLNGDAGSGDGRGDWAIAVGEDRLGRTISFNGGPVAPAWPRDNPVDPTGLAIGGSKVPNNPPLGSFFLDFIGIIPNRVRDGRVRELATPAPSVVLPAPNWTAPAAGPSEVVNMWAGANLATSFIATGRVTRNCTARIVVSVAEDLSDPLYGPATSVTGKIARVSIGGLTPDTQYYFAIEANGAIGALRGKFRTSKLGAHSFRFLAGSCTNTRQDRPMFDLMRAKNALFFSHLGDMTYLDPYTPSESAFLYPYEARVALFPTRARQLRELPTRQQIDDHDFGGNGGDRTMPGKAQALTAYREQWPMPFDPDPAKGLYWSETHGRLRFIYLDLRSAADPIDPPNPANTLMGAVQKQWFKDEIVAAKAAGQPVVILSSLVWSGPDVLGAPGQANWQDWSFERREIADYLKAQDMAGKVLLLSGDTHAAGISTGAGNDYATGGGMPMPEVLVSGMDEEPATGGPEAWDIGFARPASQVSGLYGVFDVIDGGGEAIDIAVKVMRVTFATGEEMIAEGIIEPPAQLQHTFTLAVPA